MNLIKKLILSLLVLIAVAKPININAQSVSDAMRGINKAYDSIPYISFNIKYTYTSDTLTGKSQYEVMLGQYTLAGKRAKFMLGRYRIHAE